MADFFIDTDTASTQLPQNNRPKMFMFGIPSYTNMGDQAVSLAARIFFEKEFSNYQYIEIMDYDNNAGIEAVKKIITKQDIVGYVGGGNMGSLYTDIEEDRRAVFSTFTSNLTISFPQSIHFEKTAYGEKEKQLSQEAYGKNHNLVLLARDAQSYRRMQKTFENKVVFIPDMVLYLKPTDFKFKRTGALFILRHDGEKILDESFIESLRMILKKRYSLDRTDTVLKMPTRITPITRARLFEEQLQKIARQELIISDRFHAMVFSVLTQTPCLLFGNSYGKGKHAYYDWLENISWIKYSDERDITRIGREIEAITSAQTHSYDLQPNFRPLRQIIVNYIAAVATLR
ncbi:polysaccharide pyruvyl transferase family protein [Liquorilactobacillus capillatus]|nr:polysaccharide pyruvyl transferase family protein [Liquorilactobacillus capillatus]